MFKKCHHFHLKNISKKLCPGQGKSQEKSVNILSDFWWKLYYTLETVSLRSLSKEPMYIPAKPLHNHDIVSVHFNHIPCTGICDKLSRHLSMLTYIYLNVDECSLTSFVPQQSFKLQISLNYGKLKLNVVS